MQGKEAIFFDFQYPAYALDLNIDMSSYQYRDPHVPETVLSLTRESPYLGKTVFMLTRGPGLHWDTQYHGNQSLKLGYMWLISTQWVPLQTWLDFNLSMDK